MKKAFYAGSFDPITKGHKNVIKQASELFDEVVVAVMQNESKKNPFFTLEERLELVKEVCEDIDNVSNQHKFNNTCCGIFVNVSGKINCFTL